MHDIDLGLLRVLAALHRTRNVTRAAAELGMSQSALSHALGRLREQLHDPLFVRVSRGVAPTELALSLREEVDELVARLEALTQRAPFDPATAGGRVVLATTDYFEVVALPALLRRLEREAPGVQLSVRPAGGELPREALQSGAVDLAVAGFFREVPEGFYQTRLFRDDFATATRAGRTERLDLSAWRAERHALITLRGDLSESHGRRFAYGTYSFTSPAWLLVETDLWLTAPRRLLQAYQRHFALDLFDCPVPIEPIQVAMVWHARTHRDPLQAWIRRVLGELVGREKGAPQPP